MKIPKSFYLNPNVVELAQLLLGKVLFTCVEGKISSGIITETEAYAGITDKASHAYGGRRTKRTETMYSEGGVSYVYLCYGMYDLFNIVTNVKDVPHAVLIRAIYPYSGLEVIAERRNTKKLSYKHTDGPGKLTKALGISKYHNAIDLCGDFIWLEDIGLKIPENSIISSKRIGIDYAQEDAELLYRFNVAERVVSRASTTHPKK